MQNKGEKPQTNKTQKPKKNKSTTQTSKPKIKQNKIGIFL